MDENLFDIEDTETYVDRCGEIFRTDKGRIAFHCTLCEFRFKEFLSYYNHILKEHKTHEEDKVLEINEAIRSYDEYKCEEPENGDLNFEVMSELFSAMEEDQPIYPSIEAAIELGNDIEVSDTLSCDGSDNEGTEPKTSNNIRMIRKRTLMKSPSLDKKEGEYKCPICGLGFSYKYNMKHHLNRHGKEKKHQCPKCDKKFYTGYEVKIHMRCHTQERPFLCNECGNKFPTNSLLANHLKRHRNQRDFKCKLCEKSFFDNRALQLHLQRHNRPNKTSFKCKLCASTFLQSKSFWQHQKIHEKEAPYKCEICSAGFNQKIGLFSHKKRSHQVIT